MKVALFGIMLLAAPAAAPAAAPYIEESQWVMGTELRLVVDASALPDGEARTLLADCFRIALELEKCLSRFDPDAELARLNRSAGQSVVVSPELFAWLEHAHEECHRTHGAFDPTVGTWIVDPSTRGRVEIGMDRVQLDPETRTVWLPEGLALDSGGDGKGVAVDAIVARLREAGVEALVDFGRSSWYGLGDGPKDRGWQIEVLAIDGSALGTAILNDAALSVSQSVQIQWGANGERTRHFHIWDPVEGSRVETERTGVVYSTSAAEAEVLSTALVVRGEEALADLGAREGVSAVLSPGPSLAAGWWRPAR